MDGSGVGTVRDDHGHVVVQRLGADEPAIGVAHIASARFAENDARQRVHAQVDGPVAAFAPASHPLGEASAAKQRTKFSSSGHSPSRPNRVTNSARSGTGATLDRQFATWVPRRRARTHGQADARRPDSSRTVR